MSLHQTSPQVSGSVVAGSAAPASAAPASAVPGIAVADSAVSGSAVSGSAAQAAEVPPTAAPGAAVPADLVRVRSAPADLVPGKEVARYLQPMLVDLVALALNGTQARLHVRGRHVVAIGGQLDGLVADARRFADEVAERLVALDVAADGRPTTVAATTSLPEFASGFAGEDMVLDAVVDQIDAAIARARDALGALGEIDRVGQDVIIGVVRALERHRWMFAAQVGG